MGQKRCEAIVLTTHKLGEYDKIVTLFSREEGKVRGVAKGARKLKQRFGSAFEPLSHVNIEFFEKGNSDLVRIESAELIRSFFPWNGTADMFAVMNCMSELMDGFSQERQASDTTFRLALACADAMATVDPRIILAYFEIWILKIAGLLPSINRCSTCGRMMDDAATLYASPDMGGLKCELCCRRRVAEVGSNERRLLYEFLRIPPQQLVASETGTISASVSLHRYLSQAIEHALARRVRSYLMLDPTT